MIWMPGSSWKVLRQTLQYWFVAMLQHMILLLLHQTVFLQNVPLAVRFSPGGTVIYTTFHNETQITIDMEAVLKVKLFCPLYKKMNIRYKTTVNSQLSN